MSESRASTQVRGPIRRYQIFRGDKNRHRTLLYGVKIQLFEGRTRQGQAKQHLLHLVAVVRHYFRDLVVHFLLNPIRLARFLGGNLAYNLTAGRATGRHQLAHSLRLETHYRFG